MAIEPVPVFPFFFGFFGFRLSACRKNELFAIAAPFFGLAFFTLGWLPMETRWTV